MKKNDTALIIGILLALISIVLSGTYRPYIYQNGIFDFYIADTLGSLFCIPACSLVFYGLSKRYRFWQYVLISALSFVLYEFFGLLGFGTFDWLDIVAIFISSILTLCVYWIARSITNKKARNHQFCIKKLHNKEYGI